MLEALQGLLLGVLGRLWLATLRVELRFHPSLSRKDHRPWALALWHGQLLPVLCYRKRRPTAALVSLSRDGQKMRWALWVLGFAVERGSSSRAGKAGLQAMVSRMLGAWDGAFAVDGPRGPWHQPHWGALVAAQRTGGLVVPMAAYCEKSWVLEKSWDRFEIPRPFSRVGLFVGPALPECLSLQESDRRGLAHALEHCQRLAQELLSPSNEPLSESAVEKEANEFIR